MGFGDYRDNQKQGFIKSENINKESNEEKKELKEELTEESLIEQLIESAISHVLSPDYKIDAGYSNETIRMFQTGKQLLHDTSYMDLFKKATRQYITIWNSITGKLCPDSKLYATVEEAIKNLGSLDKGGGFNYFNYNYIKEILQANASGKFDLLNNSVFDNPISDANIERKFEQERLLMDKTNKLKEIVNKPIKYGDTGNREDEINFDDEFNIFAEKLREQKMDEITIFKLVSRMGELKKQYESVIKHPDRSLLERLEAQVLLEFYEQVEKQKKEQEKMAIKEMEEQTRQIGAGMQIGTVSGSINHIEKDVSTLTWLKIIDGLFGH